MSCVVRLVAATATVFIGSSALGGGAACAPAHLVPEFVGGGSNFGAAADIAGDRIIIGRTGNQLNPTGMGLIGGSAYVFRRLGTAWVQEQRIWASDSVAGDRFGWAVGIDGIWAIVAATNHLHLGASSKGAVYVFQRSAATGAWSQSQELFAASGSPGDGFGSCVDVRGEVALIGAPTDDVAGSNAGAVYVFRRRLAAWMFEQKLTAEDAAPSDFFGNSVAVCGDIALISSVGNDEGGAGSGAVYSFRFNGTQWVQHQKLLASHPWPRPDFDALDDFGSSLALSPDSRGGLVAVIGEPFGDPPPLLPAGRGAGAAYIFRFDPRTSMWRQEQALTSAPLDYGSWFGAPASIDHDRAIVGARLWGPSNQTTGAVFIFRDTGAGWVQEQMIVPSVTSTDFARSVALEGVTAVVGAPLELGGSGGAHVYALDAAFADLNCDGRVNGFDLALLLGVWGPVSTNSDAGLAADLNGDSIVNGQDLALLLGAWAPLASGRSIYSIVAA